VLDAVERFADDAPDATVVRTDQLRSDPTTAEQLRYRVLPMPKRLQTEDGVVFQNANASAEIGRRVAEAALENMITAAQISA
jgi:creatinine amidohydrolase/Fe(II)-dependent formamide hydrolase-like protein